jgi:hypothetical protein
VKNPGWVQYRNILISMIHDISPPVLQHIRTLSGSSTFQADSLTQIIRSDDDGRDHLGTDYDEVSERGLEDDAACETPILR